MEQAKWYIIDRFQILIQQRDYGIKKEIYSNQTSFSRNLKEIQEFKKFSRL